MVWIVIIALVVIIDQVSKYIVTANIELGDTLIILDKFLYLAYRQNKGTGSNILNLWDKKHIIIIVAVLNLIIFGFVLYKARNKLLKISMAFILGATIGNLTDRITYGYVRDFLGIYTGNGLMKVLNGADMFAMVGQLLLFCYFLFIYLPSYKATSINK